MRYNPALDGLRAFAVLIVIAGHCGVPYVNAGWMGVSVFFVLSGYLITTILVREHQRNGRVDLRRFYVRRLLRLYPALIAMIVFVGVLRTLGVAPWISWPEYFLSSALAATYLGDLMVPLGVQTGLVGHTWSLAVEEQFYLLWPLVLLLVVRRRRLALLVTGLLVSASWISFNLVSFPDNYNLPFTRMGDLLLGCLLALLLENHTFARVSAQFRWLWMCASVLGFLAVAYLAIQVPIDRALQVGLPVVNISAMLLILGVVVGDRDSWPARLLATKPAVWVGRMSYGVYLYHLAIRDLVYDSFDLTWPLGTPVTVALTLGVAALSYRYVETPFLRMKDRMHAVSRHPVPVVELPSYDDGHIDETTTQQRSPTPYAMEG